MADLPIVAELSLKDGKPVTINFEQVELSYSDGDCTLIVPANGTDVRVRENYDAVAELLHPERQAGP